MIAADMPRPLLAVRELGTWITGGVSPLRAVDGVSLSIAQGETFALLGESGCGKSMTALSIARLLPDNGKIVSGSVHLNGENLLGFAEAEMRELRGRRIGMIFQEPGTSLNPVLSVGTQIAEVIERHTSLRGGEVRRRCIELLDSVGIPDASRRLGEFPFQLSGGMKQRVMIAGALACEPELLIADEPTTALDVTIQAQVLDLLAKLQAERSMSILLITHDLGVVARMAHSVGVMYAGQIVEQASRDQFFSKPAHPYSRKLFESFPSAAARTQGLAVIRGRVPAMTKSFTGCRFVDRCDLQLTHCESRIPDWVDLAPRHAVRCHLHSAGDGALPENVTPAHMAETGSPGKTVEHTLADASESNSLASVRVPLLAVDALKVHFPIRRGLFKRTVGAVLAVDGVSLTIGKGECVALVGESGCGKTTVGKAIARLLSPTAGRVMFEGVDLGSLDNSELRKRRKDFQIIFQDPFSSLDPRMRVAEIVEEGMSALAVGASDSRTQRVDELLSQVGLSADMKSRYPHEFSGGQRQRIAVARALAVNPKLLICDEPTSALDVSVQAQILNLLKDLQDRLGLSYLFITHNLSVVEFVAHRVAVMYLGRIVEYGATDSVLNNPQHPYTRALLSAVPSIDPAKGRRVIRLVGDLPSPANPPSGCHFHPRCSQATSECSIGYPMESQVSDDHIVNCHHYGSPTAQDTY